MRRITDIRKKEAGERALGDRHRPLSLQVYLAWPACSRSLSSGLPREDALRKVIFVSEVPYPKVSLEGLREIHDSIYRERVLRARAMTPEARFDSGLALTNEALQRVLEGAMWQMGITDIELGWQEARRRIDRLAKARDHAFYTTTPPKP